MSAEVGRGVGRLALTVAYDGGPFAGWQLQPDQPTVQGELERALGAVAGQPVRVMGSGRTDAGVHALGQVCHLDDPVGLPVERLPQALNAHLPGAIRVRAARPVPDEFHALHSARRKTYVYQLHLTRAAGGQRAVEAALPPHRRGTFHAVRADIDVAAMRRAASALVGRHDFTALSKAMPPERSTIKTVRSVRVLRMSRGLRLVVTGDGFLYGMVRLMAGLLVEVGRGRRAAADVPALLAARDRDRAPASLPARGLFLWRVDYPPEVFRVLD